MRPAASIVMPMGRLKYALVPVPFWNAPMPGEPAMIGLLWVALSRENRSVQDLVLRTSVVYDWQAKGAASSREAQGRPVAR